MIEHIFLHHFDALWDVWMVAMAATLVAVARSLREPGR